MKGVENVVGSYLWIDDYVIALFYYFYFFF